MQTASEVLMQLATIVKATQISHKQMTSEQWGRAVNLINDVANDLRFVISEREINKEDK